MGDESRATGVGSRKPDEGSSLNYDNLAANYARHRRIHPGVFANLISTGNLTQSSSVLEVGCGTGNYITALHEELCCRCYGIDPSAEMLAAARQRTDRISFTQARAESLDFPEA